MADDLHELNERYIVLKKNLPVLWSGSMTCAPEVLEKTWSKNMIWYGPCGIGMHFYSTFVHIFRGILYNSKIPETTPATVQGWAQKEAVHDEPFITFGWSKL